MKHAHAPEYLAVIAKLEPLLREHHWFKVKEPESPEEVARQYKLLCDWVAYFWNRGTISHVLNQDGSARAVCLIKLFRHLWQFLEPFIHDPCGRFCMVELMVAREPIAMADIFHELTERFGPQEMYLWDRGERTEGGAPRMYSRYQFEKLARRLTYGLTERKEQYGRSKNT